MTAGIYLTPSRTPAHDGVSEQALRDAWSRGFATALAESHRLLLRGNDSTGVRKIARDAGLTLASARTAGVSDFDLRELKKAGIAPGARDASAARQLDMSMLIRLTPHRGNMKRGTTVTLNRREVLLLRKKLRADAEWHFDEVDVAGDILRKLQVAEQGHVTRGR